MGDPGTALNSPHSIILTQKLAAKYFGNENPVGKVLTVENKAQFTVTGVFKEIPSNSMFIFSAVIPYSYMKEIGAADRSWGNNSIFTFIKLKKGSDVAAVNKKLTDIVAENDSRITTKFNSLLASFLLDFLPGYYQGFILPFIYPHLNLSQS